MKSLLLHTCCAPCATFCFDYWKLEDMSITSFWYNPNIHPFTEHRQRLQTLEGFCVSIGVPLMVADDYDIVSYFRQVSGQERDRCRHCFRMRLTMTARIARVKGYTAFSTTLLISPYQNQQLLRETGLDVAAREGIEFLYRDLTPGFGKSVQMSKELGLYRQKYCGCLYSEWERYGKVKV